ncbi:hypothetical protein FM106_20030 [Brachybacterium faecium]|nr:hypothetical protein FM106_20030 [Brachybacterium faecium]
MTQVHGEVGWGQGGGGTRHADHPATVLRGRDRPHSRAALRAPCTNRRQSEARAPHLRRS